MYFLTKYFEILTGHEDQQVSILVVLLKFSWLGTWGLALFFLKLYF